MDVVRQLRHLSLVRSDAELRAMRAVTRALDPRGILNPGAHSDTVAPRWGSR